MDFIEAYRAYFKAKGWTALEVSTPRGASWENYAVKNDKTGIIMYANGETKLEAASKMVLRLSGTVVPTGTGSVEALKTALVNWRRALEIREDDL